MTAYYNEIDRNAATWLRELIKQGHIADGDVDERSIEDVTPNDLRGYTQCHFFAGIGVWSYALRQAGWADDQPVWTGSCPCQPFSAAGNGKGFDDERHLWPDFHWLISQCRPDTVIGEQVAQKAGDAWFDAVSTDLEGEGYACGSVVFPACSVGAPHQRQRRYWMANAANDGHATTEDGRGVGAEQKKRGLLELEGACDADGLADTIHQGSQGRLPGWADTQREVEHRHAGCDSAANHGTPTNGFWSDADWLGCRDGKWRPVEPSLEPLVDGASARVVRLRGYGNAIVAPQATAFIKAVMHE